MTRANRGHEYRETVGPEGDGAAIAAYLAGRWPHTGVAEWAVRVAEGRVRVDGEAVPADAVLRPGQIVTWCRPGWDEPPAPRSFAVLHEDDLVLAVAKPSGLPVLPGGGFLEGTLLAAVRERFPDAAPVHRLGRATSGVVVFARTPAARAALARAWGAPETVKRYRFLATGAPPDDAFVVDAPIGPVPYPGLGTLHAATPDGRPARTRVVVLEHRDGVFLGDAFLSTGRPHQIRIHLAAAGHPLAGDPLYRAGGLPDPDGRARPGDPGYRLHAAEVHVAHPSGTGGLAVECAPPPVLRRRDEPGAQAVASGR